MYIIYLPWKQTTSSRFDLGQTRLGSSVEPQKVCCKQRGAILIFFQRKESVKNMKVFKKNGGETVVLYIYSVTSIFLNSPCLELDEQKWNKSKSQLYYSSSMFSSFLFKYIFTDQVITSKPYNYFVTAVRYLSFPSLLIYAPPAPLGNIISFLFFRIATSKAMSMTPSLRRLKIELIQIRAMADHTKNMSLSCPSQSLNPE